MNTLFRFLCLSILVLLLGGCMYPKEQLAKNQTPHPVQLETVQRAVDTYKKEMNGLLPIKTKPADTPIYEKYLIDFQPLKEKGLIDQTPGSAFENGGFYQYAIIDPEGKATVKVIDLRTAEKLRTVQAKLEAYRSVHTYPPFGKQIEGNIYELDYKKLKYKKAPSVESPYSQKKLPIIMDIDGKLYIDYRIDLYDIIKKYPEEAKQTEDIRSLLAAHYPFVPAFSLPAKAVNGEPVYINK